MRLKSVYVRFYKSFNFDYLRKYHKKAEPKPWDKMDEKFYPFIRVPTDNEITTIVGANESGKSHLLTAIEKGVSGNGIEREDFCRHSLFFSGRKGERRLPDFGFEWSDLALGELNQLRELCGLNADSSPSRFWLFRFNGSTLKIFWQEGEEYQNKDVSGQSLTTFMPHIFRIDPNIALPESVPIRRLYDRNGGSGRLDFFCRQRREALASALEQLVANAGVFSDKKPNSSTQPDVEGMKSAVDPLLTALGESDEEESQEIDLARDLIFKIAGMDAETLRDLDRALRNGREGYAQGIVADINRNLASTLNFPRFWAQDNSFALRVEARSHDLFFAVHDRTGHEYSFDERSSGLKYFLSYYIQYRAHDPAGRPEILLMDEPDTYLSSQAQQDLLKIFHGFAHPEDERPPIQVIYVTHSPFLIDKNHAERIRVLEKGMSDEGTRVVPSVSKNHYEPLRSAFGAFLGETTFIGNCNLMVEGMGDQILLAGAAAHLNTKPLAKVAEFETLDLNRITIVPAGSASHIPYLTFLARGRDEVRPAIIVLLDSDRSGNDARKAFGKKPYSRLLSDKLILQVGDLEGEAGLQSANGKAPLEIEDFVPIPLCLQAAREYSREVCDYHGDIAQELSVAALQEKIKTLSEDKSTFDALQQCFAEMTPEGLHIEKVGFARYVIQIVNRLATHGGDLLDGGASGEQTIEQFETNMKIVFRALGVRQRAAERELMVERVGQKIERAKDAFLQDHPQTATREQAVLLLENIEANLDDSSESDEARTAANVIRREFSLDRDVTESIPEYDKFKERLNAVQYAQRIALSAQDLDSDQEPQTSNEAIQAKSGVTQTSATVAANGHKVKMEQVLEQPLENLKTDNSTPPQSTTS